MHPVLCKEEDQDALKASTAKKIYRALDDIEEDANWLEERVWSTDREKFPSSVTLNGEEYPCFTPKGFAWAFSLVTSRSVFVDGTSRIVPVMDMANHNDLALEEVSRGFMGRYGTTKGIDLHSSKVKKYKRAKKYS